MDTWLIHLLSVLGLFLLIFGASYITYRIAFLANRNKENNVYLRRVEKCYGKYGEAFEKLTDNLASHKSERVFISSFDGLKLSARYYHIKDGAPIHILFHGYRSRADLDMVGAAYECMALSHNVLLVDQRAHGKSGGKNISFGINERQDLFAWCNFVISRFGENTEIFIWGVSMGAATVLMSLDLPLPKNVLAAVADCPYSSPEAIIRRVGKRIHLPVFLLFPFLKLGARIFAGLRLGGISAEKSLLESQIPVLLIHGEADNYVPCEMSEKMAKSAAAAGVDLRFIKFENAAHAMCYLENAEEYGCAVRGFINEILERKCKNV